MFVARREVDEAAVLLHGGVADGVRVARRESGRAGRREREREQVERVEARHALLSLRPYPTPTAAGGLC